MIAALEKHRLTSVMLMTTKPVESLQQRTCYWFLSISSYKIYKKNCNISKYDKCNSVNALVLRKIVIIGTIWNHYNMHKNKCKIKIIRYLENVSVFKEHLITRWFISIIFFLFFNLKITYSYNKKKFDL